jgi:hypothetical protein
MKLRGVFAKVADFLLDLKTIVRFRAQHSAAPISCCCAFDHTTVYW